MRCERAYFFVLFLIVVEEIVFEFLEHLAVDYGPRSVRSVVSVSIDIG
jgi:hypothetical protein